MMKKSYARGVTHQFQYPQYRVNMPPFIGCKPLRCQADLSSHPQLELIICDLQESEQFPNEVPDILLVDQSVGELERSPTNGYVSVAQTVKDDVPMT